MPCDKDTIPDWELAVGKATTMGFTIVLAYRDRIEDVQKYFYHVADFGSLSSSPPGYRECLKVRVRGHDYTFLSTGLDPEGGINRQLSQAPLYRMATDGHVFSYTVVDSVLFKKALEDGQKRRQDSASSIQRFRIIVDREVASEKCAAAPLNKEFAYGFCRLCDERDDDTVAGQVSFPGILPAETGDHVTDEESGQSDDGQANVDGSVEAHKNRQQRV